jgi:hypothetical protein
MRARFATALAVACAISIAACGGITDPSNNQQQQASGAFAPGGYSQGIPFTAKNGGELTVRITALAPNSTTYVGIIWTQAASDGSCNIGNLGQTLYQSGIAQLNVPAISGAQIISGQYCIFLYDSVGLTAGQTFTLVISHP